MSEKLTEAFTVKTGQETASFVQKRAVQLGFESAGEYIRSLISEDQSKAECEFSLLAEALGYKVTLGNKNAEVSR